MYKDWNYQREIIQSDGVNLEGGVLETASYSGVQVEDLRNHWSGKGGRRDRTNISRIK